MMTPAGILHLRVQLVVLLNTWQFLKMYDTQQVIRN
jgi:hypothetical protein